MTKQQFIDALTRLANSHKMGLKEASLLFLCDREQTTQRLAATAGIALQTLNGRLQALKAKKLIRIQFTEDGERVVSRSVAGQKIVGNILTNCKP
jgi:DNA-binding MarR family transcriptional regulator